IQMYDVKTGHAVRPPLVGHKSPGVSHTFSNHGDVLLSNDWSQVVRLWDTRSGRELFSAPLGSLIRGCFSPDDSEFAGQYHSGKLRTLRGATGKEHRIVVDPRRSEAHFYHDARLSADGRWLAVNTWDGLAILDAESGEELAWQSLGFSRSLGFDRD